MSDPLAWLEDELASLQQQSLLRRLTTHDGPQAARIVIDGQPRLNFGSNDYLGLAADPRLAQAAQLAMQTEGWGAGASPLITGHSAAHQRLEQQLAQFLNCEAALLFSSGFAANAGAIAALVGRGDAIFGDQKNHASIIDGCRLSRADVHVYPHADVSALRALLQQSRTAPYRRRLIVTDSLFSMDGDLAPLADLVELAQQHHAMLMVDEAHATGLFGANGRGLCEQLGIEAHVSTRMGTLSKALGCAGGFVAGRRTLIDWLVNKARSYVFSTAHPPAIAAAATAAIEIVVSEPQRRTALLQTAAALRAQLASAGWNVGQSASQIIPLYIGDPARTMQLAGTLSARGLHVPGIRPPSVPAGESLLRISLTAGHTRAMLAELHAALTSLQPQ